MEVSLLKPVWFETEVQVILILEENGGTQSLNYFSKVTQLTARNCCHYNNDYTCTALAICQALLLVDM